MRKYSIINLSDLTPERLNECRDSRGNPCDMCIEHSRKSLDGTRVIIKWDGEDPAWVAELELLVYTGGEMRDFLNGNVEWQKPDEE